MMNQGHKKGSGILFLLSAASAVLAAVVFLAGLDQIIGLAGTQWILVSILLGVYAIYFSTCCSCSSCCSSDKGKK